jgi:hypothetical protein
MKSASVVLLRLKYCQFQKQSKNKTFRITKVKKDNYICKNKYIFYIYIHYT